MPPLGPDFRKFYDDRPPRPLPVRLADDEPFRTPRCIPLPNDFFSHSIQQLEDFIRDNPAEYFSLDCIPVQRVRLLLFASIAEWKVLEKDNLERVESEKMGDLVMAHKGFCGNPDLREQYVALVKPFVFDTVSRFRFVFLSTDIILGRHD